MNITDVKIRKLFEDGPMKAIASVTFDDQLAVHDIKVIYARDKFFIVMPSRKNADGTFRAELETAVLQAYDAAVALAQAEAENPSEAADSTDE